MKGFENMKENVTTELHRQRYNQILEFCMLYIQKHGYSPTYSEIADGLNIQSKSAIHKYINEMLQIGLLETDAPAKSSRALRIPGYCFVKKQKKKQKTRKVKGNGE